MRLNNSSSDRESEASAECRPVSRLPEWLEQVRQPFRRDSGAGIGDRKPDTVLTRRLGWDADTTASGCEFQCVADEVRKGLEESVTIGDHLRQPVRHLTGESLTVVPRLIAKLIHDIGNERSAVDTQWRS